MNKFSDFRIKKYGTVDLAKNVALPRGLSKRLTKTIYD